MLLAWIPVIAIHEVAQWIPAGGLALIGVGGLLYLIGIYFLANDEKTPYFHAVWHLFVVSASICHFCAVMFYLLPPG